MNENPVFQILRGLVDYAGLFPPAKLPMERTVNNYADYLSCPQSWLLAKLIVPISRLSEFEELAGNLLPRGATGDRWHISGLLPPADAPMTRDLSAAMREVEGFNLRHATPEFGLAHIDALEVRCNCHESIETLVNILPAGISAYVELAMDEEFVQNLDVIARHRDRLHAKIRTGGITEDLIPSPTDVAHFIASCVAREVPFKATAGLHHPIRAEHPLTYERDPDIVFMHGFLNVLLATGGLVSGQLNEDQAEGLLRETDAGAFTVDGEGWQWKTLRLGPAEIQATRLHGLHSFGSCSFIEPVEDLQALGHSLSLTTTL